MEHIYAKAHAYSLMCRVANRRNRIDSFCENREHTAHGVSIRLCTHQIQFSNMNDWTRYPNRSVCASLCSCAVVCCEQKIAVSQRQIWCTSIITEFQYVRFYFSFKSVYVWCLWVLNCVFVFESLPCIVSIYVCRWYEFRI